MNHDMWRTRWHVGAAQPQRRSQLIRTVASKTTCERFSVDGGYVDRSARTELSLNLVHTGREKRSASLEG